MKSLNRVTEVDKEMSKAQGVDLTNFTKFKETKDHIIYINKDYQTVEKKEIIVYYKQHKMGMRSLLTDELFTLFFSPEDYKKIYMQEAIIKHK